ncbi:MAG TPA: transglycosylase SLT domain-containing protein [Chthoniobacteraceae bacterium]|nr:transglycosylase SLT domain-containing protein [Chthoniobacteraceae bacterium]
MFRLLRKLVLVLILAAIAAAGLLVFTSPDPMYAAQELLSFGRYAQQDSLIKEMSAKHKVDPALVKAIVWRESGFHPSKLGTKGERGLMQVGEAAAADWSRAAKVETFVPTDLFEPRTNVEVGAWYVSRALEKWKEKDNPIPFALAEYNAGASRVDRWMASTGAGSNADAHDLVNAIDFPTTRRYVEDIVARHQFYRNRGGL